MAKNANLHAAKSAKNDEFYTQLSDIENELKHYKEHFKGKTVFCNCGDAMHHNFGKYFAMNFEILGLKKLMCTTFNMDGSPAKVAMYYGDKNGNRIPDPEEWEIHNLKGNGDFRSEECIELLKQADIVVSNPPFSLFREYVAQLVEYGKKFLIIGNMNAITYKEIFPLIKENKLWWGCSTSGSARNMWFSCPEEYDANDKNANYKEENGTKYRRVQGIEWFTNLDHKKRHEPLDLYKRYSNEYPKYDNYDAIEVSKVAEIPMDYDGVMGVPITFLDKYCPEQFEIVGATESEGTGFSNGVFNGGSVKQGLVNGQKVYKRLFIRLIKTLA